MRQTPRDSSIYPRSLPVQHAQEANKLQLLTQLNPGQIFRTDGNSTRGHLVSRAVPSIGGFL